jgi:Fe-S oxidoreductase
MESDFPSELQQTFRGMENNFNPWGIGSSTRADWAKGLEIKNAAADKDIEVLWFVGCAGSYDERVKKVSHAFADLLQTAGVNFGFLGAEEKCCGETARRLGNEYLAQTLMAMNVARFNELGIKKIITFCPHCYNTFKNEYPQFGGQFEVQHHTEFLHDLIKGGQIKLKSGLAQMKVCYHDSCFLGRYNDIYTEPRKILTSVSGVTLTEMDKNLARSFCCGAGGGRMWLEEHQGQRINELRTAQALEKGPDAIATACPYCLTMIDDALKAKDMHESVKNLDIAEFIFHAMQR